MPELNIELVSFGSTVHQADIASFRERGLAVPHPYVSRLLHDRRAEWHWSRALDASGRLLVGFALQLSRSRAVPWARIGNVERIGRLLHADSIPVVGAALVATANRIPRLLWLDVQVFDEDADRRSLVGDSILSVGGVRCSRHRSYSRTLVLDLRRSDDDLMKSVSQRARRKIREFNARSDSTIRPLRDAAYVGRIRRLYEGAFRRTGGGVPPLNIEGVLADAAAGNSELLGAFWSGRTAPDDLLAFAWSRFHGDHLGYDVAASERSDDLGTLAPGYALIEHLAAWGRLQGATWMDLGGIIGPDKAADHPLQGITNFKRAFTRQESIVTAEYQVVPDSMLATVSRRLRSAAQLVRR